MRRWKKTAVTSALVTLLTVNAIPHAYANEYNNALPLSAQSASTLTWRRLGGDSRYDTMQEISRQQFEESVWAIIASGESFADALSASALAGAVNAPILTTSGSALSKQAKEELERLKVKHVVIVGGTSAVNPTVEEKIKTMGIECERITGNDRQGTSLAVLQRIVELQKANAIKPKSDVVFIATGNSFADALSISPWAYAYVAPILLTGQNGLLSAKAIKAIEEDDTIRQAILIGGEGVVSTAVADQIAKIERGVATGRIGGKDRYDTSCLITDWETRHGLGWQTPVIASGKNFPDALAGATLAGGSNSCMLLIDDMRDSTWGRLDGHSSEASFAYLLGGEDALMLSPTGDPELDSITSRIISDVTGAGESGLRAAYEYVSGFGYSAGNKFPAGDWTTWSAGYAKEMYRNGSGNCYRYASLLAWVARALGYDARPVSGMTLTSDGQVAHGWVEVTQGERTLIMDPERHHFMPNLNLFMVTYDAAPLYYYATDGTQYV